MKDLDSGGLKGDFKFPGDDMDNFRAAQEAGWKSLGSQLLEDTTGAAVALFQAAPASTRLVILTIRGGTLTMTTDGTAPTVGAHGIDYPVGGPYSFPLNDAEAKKCKGISTATTGWAEFWGLP